MSKVISSHNLAQLDYIVQEIENKTFIANLVFDNIDELNNDTSKIECVYSFLRHYFSNMEIIISDLKVFENCIRSETDFNSDEVSYE